AITNASAREERPSSSMVTMSSALSASSEVRIRESTSSCSGASGAIAALRVVGRLRGADVWIRTSLLHNTGTREAKVFYQVQWAARSSVGTPTLARRHSPHHSFVMKAFGTNGGGALRTTAAIQDRDSRRVRGRQLLQICDAGMRKSLHGFRVQPRQA